MQKEVNERRLAEGRLLANQARLRSLASELTLAEERERHFLHRGIASRQFQRAFLLADGMQVLGADLVNGLLSVDLVRPEPERVIKKINITARD